MKFVFWALVLGIFLNASTVAGHAWPIGSVAAIVIMGVWIKVSMDRQFEKLEEQLKGRGADWNNERKEQ